MSNQKTPDDFWDLKALIPPKKQPDKSHARKITTAEINIPKASNNGTDNSSPSDRKLSANILKKSPANQPKKRTYQNDSSLVKKVEIYDWATPYNYYDLFCKQARYYRTLPPHECKPESFFSYLSQVRFFSYLPQFSQMSKEQIDWYIWWKYKIGQNVFLDTDYTYILLYSFELINLSNESDAEKSLNIMIDMWKNYRDTYPHLDGYLGEWICDFALIHNLTIKFPDSRISKEMIQSTSLPEVFYNFDFHDSNLLAKFLLSYCNSYNYRKSKFYDEKTKPFFEKHIPASFALVVKSVNINNAIFSASEKSALRTSYTGALCSYNAKKKIEVSYIALSVELELKKSISDIIKYSENLIRSHLGCRSRLGVKDINPSVKRLLDNYFSEALKTEAHNFNTPEYEKLYDRVSEPLSPEAANKIETSSWDITEKLIEAFEEEETKSDVTASEDFNILTKQKDVGVSGNPILEFYNKISAYKEVFELIRLENYTEQKRHAKENKIMLEAATDEINEIASDIFGDILIEEAEEGYRIIEEYKNLLQ